MRVFALLRGTIRVFCDTGELRLDQLVVLYYGLCLGQGLESAR